MSLVYDRAFLLYFVFLLLYSSFGVSVIEKRSSVDFGFLCNMGWVFAFFRLEHTVLSGVSDIDESFLDVFAVVVIVPVVLLFISLLLSSVFPVNDLSYFSLCCVLREAVSLFSDLLSCNSGNEKPSLDIWWISDDGCPLNACFGVAI